MTELNYTLPEIGEPSIAADPRTLQALVNIKTWAEGHIDSANLKAEGVEGPSIKKESITEVKLSAAVAALLNSKVSGLAAVGVEANSTVKGGELFFINKAAVTTTLPPPVANVTVGVYCNVGVASTTVTAPGGLKIYGDFTNGATSVVLTELQHVVLHCVGGTAWFIEYGEPKREAVWTTGIATEGTPSASRQAEIAINALAAKGTGAFKLTLEVGGVIVGEAVQVQSEAIHVAATVGPFRVPAGLTWKATGTNNETIHFTQLLL